MSPSSMSQSAALHRPRAPWGDTRREFSEGVDGHAAPVLAVLWLVSPGGSVVTTGVAAQALWPWGEAVAGRYPALWEQPSRHPTGSRPDRAGKGQHESSVRHDWDCPRLDLVFPRVGRGQQQTWWQGEVEPQTQSDCHAVPCHQPCSQSSLPVPGPSTQPNTRSVWCPETHEGGGGGDMWHKVRPGSEETLEGEPSLSRLRATVSVAVPGLHPFPATPGGGASLQLHYPVLGTGCPRVEAGGAPGSLGCS